MELKPMETAHGWNREALKWLHRSRKERSTGRLEARSTSALREVFFREGRIVGIRTSVESERLGELLMRVGRITRQHFEDASIFVRKGIRIGQILAELRILDRAEIDPPFSATPARTCGSRRRETSSPLSKPRFRYRTSSWRRRGGSEARDALSRPLDGTGSSVRSTPPGWWSARV
jgi:hypothetical protein